jgi:hypothetical protein
MARWMEWREREEMAGTKKTGNGASAIAGL